MENEYLDYSFQVNSFDMDLWGYMKPTVILNICQEVAYMHSSKLGFGFDQLHSMGTAWILSRATAEIERLPIWREEIRVRTWHKGQSGIFALRDYIFYDNNDKPIIRVTTSWIIINIASRRLVRADRIFGKDKDIQLLEYNEDAITKESEKLDMPTEKIFCGDHSVVYSDLDVNQHVNNVKYIEMACDHTPQQIDKDLFLSYLSINFNHEAKSGEKIDIYSSADNNNQFIEGAISDRNIFIAKMKYKRR